MMNHATNFFQNLPKSIYNAEIYKQLLVKFAKPVLLKAHAECHRDESMTHMEVCQTGFTLCAAIQVTARLK